jgi:hypothetical protein
LKLPERQEEEKSVKFNFF